MSDGRVTKKVKQGKIDIDNEDSALLVNYELETVRFIMCIVIFLRLFIIACRCKLMKMVEF